MRKDPLSEQLSTAESLAENLAVIREWLENDPDLSPEAAAAVQAYADTAERMLQTGTAFLAAGRAIEALAADQQGAGP